ncbi:unnamed protein product [Closterium sp. NIES-54]
MGGCGCEGVGVGVKSCAPRHCRWTPRRPLHHHWRHCPQHPAAPQSASLPTSPLRSSPLPTARSPTAPWSASQSATSLLTASLLAPPLPASPKSAAPPRPTAPWSASASLPCRLLQRHVSHRQCFWPALQATSHFSPHRRSPTPEPAHGGLRREEGQAG